MTKLLLSGLVASMLALTGLVAFNSYNTTPVTAPDTQLTAVESESGCCHKESLASEEGGCCKQAAKSACCSGDSAVMPVIIAPNAGAKKE
jgi:hypothetical protein